MSATGGSPPATSQMIPLRAAGRALLRLRTWDGFGILCGLVILLVVIGVASPGFFSGPSVIELIRGSVVVGVLACGMVLLLSMGEIDLSVGSVFGLSLVAGALCLQAGINPWIALGVAALVGALLGAVNGLISVFFQLPLILVTLGTLSVYRGLVFIITGGAAITGFATTSPAFVIVGGSILGVSSLIWILGIVFLVLATVYRLTPFGIRVRSIGSNRNAALFSGVPVRRTLVEAAALTGLLAGVCGAGMLAFYGNADPNAGVGLELQVLAAAIIGGTALSGGSGSVGGAVLGAIFLNAINTALIFLGLPSTYSTFVTGTVIVLAVCLDSTLRNLLFRRVS